MTWQSKSNIQNKKKVNDITVIGRVPRTDWETRDPSALCEY